MAEAVLTKRDALVATARELGVLQELVGRFFEKFGGMICPPISRRAFRDVGLRKLIAMFPLAS